jgi:hypothetical protein
MPPGLGEGVCFTMPLLRFISSSALSGIRWVYRIWSLLCQGAVGSGVLGWVMTGPGSDFSEELVWGCEPAKLESESFPGALQGPSRVA